MILDIAKGSTKGQILINAFSRKLVGQHEGAQAIIDLIDKFEAGLNPPHHPIGNVLFLGPTGSGKTRTVEVAAEALWGNENACLKVDCAEFQHGHEIAKLIGSPPGYLGHRETHPMFTNEALKKFHTPQFPCSIVLFDEIEKSSDTLWNLMLGILDKAQCSTGTNESVDFQNTIIVMTSNLGSKQMSESLGDHAGFSYQAFENAIAQAELDKIAREAAKRKFSPEFFNRIDKTVVYHLLSEEDFIEILDIELGELQQRILRGSKISIFFTVNKAARIKLLEEACKDKKYGARSLKRAIENRIATPLTKLIASKQVEDKDVIIIKEEGCAENFIFTK